MRMPYIPKKDRVKFDKLIDSLLVNIETYGEINYVISKLFKELVKTHGESYNSYNSLVGVLECIKLEMFRTRTGPYENTKKQKNGDI